jgi:glycosyltransferase involved in cell wall biosynthesis
MERKNDPPFLTVIIAAYQAERFLQQCLQSLLEQTVLDFQVIIVDDASTDGTRAIAAEFEKEDPQRFVCYTLTHRGLGAVRNYGLSLVQTPYVQFLDADDWLPKDFVACVKRKLDKSEETDLLFTLPRCYNEQTREYEPWYDHDVIVNRLCRLPEPFNAHTSPILFGLQPSSCSKVYRTGFLKRIAFAFPQGVLWEDVYPHFFIVGQAQTCRVMPESGFVYRRNHGQQITQTRSKRALDMAEQLQKVYQLLQPQTWGEECWAYYLARVMQFSKWMFSLCVPAVVFQLSRQTHRLYCEIDGRYWQYYLKAKNKPDRKDVVFYRYMRSFLWLPLGYLFFLYKNKNQKDV